MKVVYVRTQFWFNLKAGGSVGHTLGVLNGLKENKCQVFVIANEHFLGIEEFDYSVIEPKIKRYPSGEVLYNFYAGGDLERKLLELKPDFIYHRYTGYTFFVSKIARKLNIPLILEFNSFDTWKMKYSVRYRDPVRRFLTYLFYRIMTRIEVYNLKNASLIVTVSRPLKRDLQEMGISADKILVSANGVDPDKFNPTIGNNEKCQQLRQKLGVSNKTVVGFVGTFGTWHDIPQLTRAIDNILKDQLLSNVHFLLIGEGRLKAEMKKQLGHYPDVTFTGTVPYSEIQDYLAICDVLVSPHNPQVDGREFFGSPTKVFEYMAMGKGIVASNLGQIGEILTAGSAVLVKPGNVDELTQGIIKLVTDDDLRQQLGQQARERAVANYTWQQNAARLIEAGKNLAATE